MDTHPTDQALSSFGLGRLDDGSAEAVAKHLEECADCRKRVAEISADSFLERVRDARRSSGASSMGWSQSGGTQSHRGAAPVTPPAADTLPPGLADHPDYDIKRELGRGGMGIVYLAHNTLMGRDEVLKVMGRHIMERPGVLDRFIREIRAVAKLRHPNIVTAYAATRVGDSIVFAMEYVEGFDLSKMVKARKPLPVAYASNFIHQAALGLQHAHEEGLVHRDIKPGNLMLSRKSDRPIVKILDFGLAKLSREEKVDGGLTHEGQALGTPDYIAPEQILNAPDVDIRADIYSLGGTLYYLLTGRPPFRAKSLYDLYQAHISRDADPLNLVRPDVPAELAALVGKMMAKEPDRRFQTPGEVAEALAPFFKKANAAFKAPKPDISQVGQPDADRVASAPTQPARDAGDEGVRSGTGPQSTAAVTRWESLIELRGQDRSGGAAPTVEPTRWPPWAWPSVAIGALVFGLSSALLGGVFKVKTSEGVIVLGDLPRDANIFVDGDTVTVSWPGGGKPAVIRPAPGRHKLEVKKGGFTTFVKELTVKTDESQEVTVRLEPLVSDRPGKGEADAPDAKVGNAEKSPGGTVGSPTGVVANTSQALVDKPPVSPRANASNGTGNSPTRAGGFSAPSPAKAKSPLPRDRWIELDPTQGASRPGELPVGRHSFQDGVLTMAGGGHVYFPSVRARDMIIRAQVKVPRGKGVRFLLRELEEGGHYVGNYLAWFSRHDDGTYDFGVGMTTPGNWTDLKGGWKKTVFDDFVEFKFAAVGDLLTIYVDGAKVLEIRDTTNQLGSPGVATAHSGCLIKDLEVKILRE